MASWLSRAGRQVSDTPRRHMRTRNRTMRDAPRHARESSVVRRCYAKDHDRLDASSDQASRRSVRVEPGRALRFTSEGKADAAGIGDARVMTGGRQYLQIAFGMRKRESIYVRPDGSHRPMYRRPACSPKSREGALQRDSAPFPDRAAITRYGPPSGWWCPRQRAGY